jgi:hypothetical protein
VEGYAAGGELAALTERADGLIPGLGPLVAALAGLVADAAAAETLDAMEVLSVERGREITRGALQLALDRQAQDEPQLPGLIGADGEKRGCRERGSSRTMVTTLGEVTVRRIAYRSRKKAVPDLHWRDCVLNLPGCSYSWHLQRLVVTAYRSGSCDAAVAIVGRATGVRIGKRQVEEIAEAAAADAGAFAEQRPAREVPVIAPRKRKRKRAGRRPVLVLSADGKGVLMRPGALRPDAARKAARKQKTGKRLGSGQKNGYKRTAETGVVFESFPPDGPDRTPEEIFLRPPGEPARHPLACNRWYTCGITASRAEVIALLFAEAGRRDPGHEREWLALVDGDAHQIDVIKAQAGARGADVTILTGLIHVIEYLWKAAWCFTPAGNTPAAEQQVIAWGLDILHGNSRDVIADIERQAAANPPKPGGEHEKNIRRTTGYLTAKEPYLDYPTALANGWPIATGVIEGACRHLVGDRMGITGARWTLDAAQAILWLRAIDASGDDDAYWTYHIQQEHHRNHLSKYQNTCALAA